MILVFVFFILLTAAPISFGVISRRREKDYGPLLKSHLLGVLISIFFLLFSVFLSLRYGALEISWTTTWKAVFDYDITEHDQVVIRELRAPRTMIGIAAGSCLAVAGALTQGITRNPLGSPGLLGINAGAAFAIVTAISIADIVTAAGYVWFAFLGATMAAILVYSVAHVGGKGATPVKLALAGVIVTTLLGAWISSLLLLDQETLDEARFWLAGSISGRGTDELMVILPLIIAGLIMGLMMGKQVNLMNLGEDIAVSLGQRVSLVRAIAGTIIIVLSGSAVAIAGPIAFVGLAIPHMVRSLVGPDYRWILFYCLFFGPCLLLCADVIGRLVVPSSELQAGIVTAVVGAPFLIYLVRFTKIAEL
ncbi:MAG: iron ABC transporter permease [Actinobacteria bacterium]|nr:iron ABC transporter permease [Actinomycetota bacterium]|tara:strand:- start:9427 stop:10518 length:1092 start_codon:yes stop_codon:yes gene_type:complete